MINETKKMEGWKKYISLKEVICPEEWPRRGLFFISRQCSSLICKRAGNSELIWGQLGQTWTFVRFIFIKHQTVCCLKSVPAG